MQLNIRAPDEKDILNATRYLDLGTNNTTLVFNINFKHNLMLLNLLTIFNFKKTTGTSKQTRITLISENSRIINTLIIETIRPVTAPKKTYMSDKCKTAIK